MSVESEELVKIKALYTVDEALVDLMEESTIYMSTLYPQDSNHLVTAGELMRDEAFLAGLYVDDELAAIGGFVVHKGYVEIKRVFVKQFFRGRGFSKTIMEFLEDQARKLGARMAKLETGIKQTEAICLYRSIGYEHCAPFGDYIADHFSFFFQKRL